MYYLPESVLLKAIVAARAVNMPLQQFHSQSQIGGVSLGKASFRPEKRSKHLHAPLRHGFQTKPCLSLVSCQDHEVSTWEVITMRSSP